MKKLIIVLVVLLVSMYSCKSERYKYEIKTRSMIYYTNDIKYLENGCIELPDEERSYTITICEDYTLIVNENYNPDSNHLKTIR